MRTTKDFEKTVAPRSRTEAIARHLTDFLEGTDRFAKTIVFCVEQEHADERARPFYRDFSQDVLIRVKTVVERLVNWKWWVSTRR